MTLTKSKSILRKKNNNVFRYIIYKQISLHLRRKINTQIPDKCNIWGFLDIFVFISLLGTRFCPGNSTVHNCLSLFYRLLSRLTNFPHYFVSLPFLFALIRLPYNFSLFPYTNGTPTSVHLDGAT